MNSFNIFKMRSLLKLSYEHMYKLRIPIMLSKANETRSYHTISTSNTNFGNYFLQTQTPSICQSNGMKQKVAVKRRCADCVLVWRKGRLYNICKTKPRHNQMSKVKPEKETWILTFSSVKPRREW